MNGHKEELLKRFSAKAWKHFFEISKIPRPSYKEEKVNEYIKSVGENHGWDVRQDKAGNVVLSVPGKGALKDFPPVIIQGHSDMVCEKNNDCNHDFDNDPIPVVVGEEWITTEGTTLGADNGVAVAMALAVAEEEMDDRLPLEILITVAEETGLFGANNLDPSIVTGKTMLNLDSEELGTFTIGCAGGATVKAKFDVEMLEKPVKAVKCVLKGFRGGHSGVDVHRRENAIISAGKLLAGLDQDKLTLHKFSGGSKFNAIPRECEFLISGFSVNELKVKSSDYINILKSEESGAELTFEEVEIAQKLPVEIVKFISGIPNGVLSMHPDFEGIVETSSSLTVSAQNKQLALIISIRSSNDLDKAKTVSEAVSFAVQSGASVEEFDNYEGWQPRKGSIILKKAIDIFQDILNFEPLVSAIHAGLECGILGTKIGTGEMLSFGPTILYPHSPDERLEIASFDKTYRFLMALVQSPLTCGSGESPNN